MSLDTTIGGSAADSYVSIADALTYHAAMGNADWAAAAEADQEVALRRATRYLDGRYRNRWRGSRKTRDQALAWPRINVYDEDGFIVSSTTIPDAIEKATLEAAIRELAEPGALTPDLDRGGQIKREKVGDIEVEYTDGATARTVLTQIDEILSGLLGAGGGNTVFLDRA